MSKTDKEMIGDLWFWQSVHVLVEEMAIPRKNHWFDTTLYQACTIHINMDRNQTHNYSSDK